MSNILFKASVIAVFAVALSLSGCSNQNNSQNGEANTMPDTTKISQSATNNAALENIFARTSVRSFKKDQPISKDDLTQIVKAGMAAPSGMNLQPWQFVVVTERAGLDKLAENLPYAKMLLTATAAIIVCGDMDVRSKGEDGYCFWMEDCSAATENILLAAESMGLGGVWTAAYPYEERMSWVNECIALPANVKPLCVIPLGYPDGEQQPKDKWNEQKLHWEKW
jgi:nitroreductase